MDIVNQIIAWSEAFLPANQFVVDVEHKNSAGKLTVYIDSDEALDINACRLLSRHLSEQLDALDYGDTPYYLEVSSPGADKPLKVKRQFHKHIGRELSVTLKAATVLEGKLDAVEESKIVLLLKDKKKGYKEATAKEISFDDIAEASVIISFK
ncbi:MAG: ribosome maturation factor RimP [Bacteroidia bacterium]|jgi:ribosome maturation factor RimP|nr:ribosome maturation factor RimP [Bacteroidia bacterium]